MKRFCRVLVVDAEEVEGGYNIMPRDNFTNGFISTEDFIKFFMNIDKVDNFKDIELKIRYLEK